MDATGREFSIRLRIGRPYEIASTEWACAVGLGGLHDKLRDPHGVDSFQALMLAQRLARQLLNYFIEDGGQLLNEEGGKPLSVAQLLDSGVL